MNRRDFLKATVAFVGGAYLNYLSSTGLGTEFVAQKSITIVDYKVDESALLKTMHIEVLGFDKSTGHAQVSVQVLCDVLDYVVLIDDMGNEYPASEILSRV